MNLPSSLLAELKKCQFKVSTDTRKDVADSIYFALKGENFDGSRFVGEAFEKGAVAAVTDSSNVSGERIYQVDDALAALQETASIYRKSFSIPIIAIGGSNGKTTTKELLKKIFETKYRVHATSENFNNHIGVPLSILAMPKDSEVAIFEIGANHYGEHTKLLEILVPTITIVTNNGMDHLEGFGSPEGVVAANQEIIEWAEAHEAIIPKKISLDAKTISSAPLTFEYNGREYKTNMAGNYNLENIIWAVSIGNVLGIETHRALEATAEYVPQSKRSEFREKDGNHFIVDCYNANPSSMRLALESFVESAPHPRGVILGDMLELGKYADEEHLKIVEYLNNQKLDRVALVGEHFKKALESSSVGPVWFANSAEAGKWLSEENLNGYTFLLKGSRGTKIENVLGM